MKAIILCVSLLATSCVAARITPSVLFPPARLAWPAVEEDYLRGVDDLVADGEAAEAERAALVGHAESMGSALEAESQGALRAVPWTIMRPIAQRGIDDRLEDKEIGPGVAESLELQLQLFTETILQLQGLQ